ncbi:MAG TPA: cytoplasmic protein [Bacteroidales bacterium]|nr:MAG: cytoplasmic protein [Bacteroidetes bacterium GWE2_42_24]OFY28434.1 MAG: cytoplasmic protein [Bacteroidetes bacterium GWF2_43_11]HBZ65663.1 cytoplasmic protein [Bacteroidales bacterium]
MDEIVLLSNKILDVHQYFKQQALKQVNNALTLRNWIIGHYIVEFEQQGNDRAEYGGKTLKLLSNKLSQTGNKGFSDRNLRLFRQFYLEYPAIWQLLIAKFQCTENKPDIIWQSLTAKFTAEAQQINNDTNVLIKLLLDKLSFTHFIELLKIDDPLKRTFYEIQTIQNNWTVELLKRNTNSLLYERIGLSSDKKSMLKKLTNETLQQMPDIIKCSYLLEFLGIEEKAEYSETDLEQAIINHLQKFLMEMGRGFCFEARQKRITFNNRHYRIDLVFYHRILKCHVLIDLKLGEFDHADAGQMNVYLNYYKENESSKGDNPPVGIILCSQKDDALVHYATGGLPQEVFVTQYLLQLPSVEELKKLLNDEIKHYEE